jgi:hypothetical protein
MIITLTTDIADDGIGYYRDVQIDDTLSASIKAKLKVLAGEMLRNFGVSYVVATIRHDNGTIEQIGEYFERDE